jgi:hypothetical protein
MFCICVKWPLPPGGNPIAVNKYYYYYYYYYEPLLTAHEHKLLPLVASSPLCDSILIEIKCINVHHITTIFPNCWRKQLHVSALFWVGHHQVETRISEKTRSCSPILDVRIVVYEFSLIFWSQPDDGPPRKGLKHVVVFFNNLKIKLCYDRHLCT